MPDPRFYTFHGPLSLSEAARICDGTPVAQSGVEAEISNVAPISNMVEGALAFAEKKAVLENLPEDARGVCCLKPGWEGETPDGVAVILSDNPKLAFAQILARLFKSRPFSDASEASTEDLEIGPGSDIAPTAVLSKGVKIGADCIIGANVVIGPGVEIGSGSRVEPGVVISHAIIGARALLSRGVMIGQDGFGFALSDRGLIRIPQLGRVVIGDDVELGSNTTIDRGALDDTEIGDGAKIDNLVQIGHNVKIGPHVVIAGQAGVSGSSTIGAGAALGGQAGVADHVVIGEGAQLAANAGLMHAIPPREKWAGSPAKPVRAFFREQTTLARLSEKERTRNK